MDIHICGLHSICTRVCLCSKLKAVLLLLRLRELVPDLSKATERRQLWLDARDALSKHSACARRPLDDEESFAAFVGIAAVVAVVYLFVDCCVCQVHICTHQKSHFRKYS